MQRKVQIKSFRKIWRNATLPNSSVLWMCRLLCIRFSTGYPSAETATERFQAAVWEWLTNCLYCCFNSCVSKVFSTPTRCLSVSRCSRVMECLHGPGTSVIVRGKLRNISTHRHFTCNWSYSIFMSAIYHRYRIIEIGNRILTSTILIIERHETYINII